MKYSLHHEATLKSAATAFGYDVAELRNLAAIKSKRAWAKDVNTHGINRALDKKFASGELQD